MSLALTAAFFGVEKGDIGECVHCGNHVMPWHLGCEGCGKYNWSTPDPAPECFNCQSDLVLEGDGRWHCHDCERNPENDNS